MAKGATARRIDEVPTDQTWLPGFSGGPPSPPPSAPTAPAVSNARLGLLVFLGAEAMFFVGLIGAFLVFRLGSEVWPPPAQPRLPVGVTGINTVILLFSGLTGHLALRAVRDGDSKRPLWTHGIQWDLRYHLLHVDRLSWTPRVCGCDLVDGCAATVETWTIHVPKPCRCGDLFNVLDVRSWSMACALRTGLSLLGKDVDSVTEMGELPSLLTRL